MKKNINLNSEEWCNIVFEQKNKEYGAYQLRQTSSNRHLLALGITVLCTGLLVFSASLAGKINPTEEHVGGYSEILTLTEIPMEIPEEPEKFIDPVIPPPPPLVSSIKFTPPLIVDAIDCVEGEQLLSQDELNSTNVLISVATITTDHTEGADIADVLREQHAIMDAPLYQIYGSM